MDPEVQEVRIDPMGLGASLGVPRAARGLVIFAHGSGSGRTSPRNRFVASALRRSHFATLLLDLLVPAEEGDRARVFDIALLADRLGDATRWAAANPSTASLAVGYFGASTGAAAALVAASRPENRARAVVSRGGRPDLAGAALARVEAPVLLIVGSLDTTVVALNEQALAQLACDKRIEIVPGAGHLFEERGTLDEVVRLAIGWFERCLPQTKRNADARRIE